jgi:hypothetical protein
MAEDDFGWIVRGVLTGAVFVVALVASTSRTPLRRAASFWRASAALRRPSWSSWAERAKDLHAPSSVPEAKKLALRLAHSREASDSNPAASVSGS